MIANEMANDRDLDDLMVVPVADDSGKNALDLFLGVHGWRGVRKNVADEVGVEIALATPTAPVLFSKDNISLSALRSKVNKAVEDALIEWNAQWSRTYAELVESQRVAQAQLRQAVDTLEAYDRQPAETAWLAAVALLVVSLGRLCSLACRSWVGGWRKSQRGLRPGSQAFSVV